MIQAGKLKVGDYVETFSYGIGRIIQKKGSAMFWRVRLNHIKLGYSLDYYLEKEKAQVDWKRISKAQGDLLVAIEEL